MREQTQRSRHRKKSVGTGADGRGMQEERLRSRGTQVGQLRLQLAGNEALSDVGPGGPDQMGAAWGS